MFDDMKTVLLMIVLAPLAGSILAGMYGKLIGRSGAHWVTIIGVGVSCLLSILIFKQVVFDGATFNEDLYVWLKAGDITFKVGFMVDKLTAMMMVVVTFVSWMVHIYTIGYMSEDPGYQRFFSYISLFTFSMLMLVMSNNFMQLFFGWEAVGLVSYLLIGFWYKKETAIFANMKAFLVNRVGDFGFLLGIAGVLMYFGTLDYVEVFASTDKVVGQSITVIPWFGEWSVLTLICIFLFIGAMGKSAQVPLHVWLPDSMEGPTPISALIHAATMVTAGIFMVARMSPLFELSETALTVVIIIGAITALFMGFLGLIQNDIKRVVAYSTLSQLGYMTVALGASAYAAGIFHLMTHAFFKALLFLGAGSVIIAMHHEQDMRKMGGLRKYLPITWITSLIGSLALIGTPFFSGFYSKDSIIEAVGHSNLPGSGFAYVSILLGVFITALYSFRMYFLVFHGKERMDEHTRSHLHETPWVVTLPLILLAIPSFMIGMVFVGDMAFGDFFGSAIFVLPEHDVLAALAKDFHGPIAMVQHGLSGLPFYLALAGVVTAYYFYMKRPDIPEMIQAKLSIVHKVLENKYFFDWFYETYLARGCRSLGNVLWNVGDVKIIDGVFVNGSAKTVGVVSSIVRHIQTGYLYHYAFVMIIGLIALVGYFVIYSNS
ncbi:NADH-ubiquinone oxidoreductase chain L [hydrothermal vent metagenome]|uniref:NADH-ubiquinone oxidoreductase chain L n=1 Tax=hydrothermal vent metagenome TaxID=652676 RepID=A0A3B1AFM4_9ZZZZ